LEELPFLNEYPELAIHNLNQYLTLLDLSDNIDWTNEKIKIAQGKFLRAALGTKYNNLLTLTETIKREEAIELYKIYITQYSSSLQEGKENRFETLQDFWKERTKPLEKDDWLGIIGNVENGKIYYRKEICAWMEALKEFPDASSVSSRCTSYSPAERSVSKILPFT